MKIPIIDLMDCYFDDSIKLDAAPVDRDKGAKLEPPKRFGPPKIMVAAAILLLVLSSAFVIYLRFSQAPDSGNALQDAQPLNTFSAFPTPTAETAAADSVEETTADADTVLSPIVLSGADISWNCYGNLFMVDDVYYTMTADGPAVVETEHLKTTVELYGLRNIDLDYAVIDGELAFHNNDSAESYTIIDGKIVTWSEYADAYAYDTLSDMGWQELSAATATPVDGSADTVILTVLRENSDVAFPCYYSFLYNVFTGEISDPLANIPDLFDHGNLTLEYFNSSCTRALAQIYVTENGNMQTGEFYICDLVNGTMTALSDCVSDYIPDPQFGGTVELIPNICQWADDDALIFWIQEGYLDDALQDVDSISVSDYAYWVCVYDVATDTILDRQPVEAPYTETFSSNKSHLHRFLDDTFLTYDTSDGSTYSLSGLDLGDFWSNDWCDTDTRTVFRDSGNAIYLADDEARAWVRLSDYMENVPTDIQMVVLLTDQWLCIQDSGSVYCYSIPDGLPMTPLEGAEHEEPLLYYSETGVFLSVPDNSLGTIQADTDYSYSDPDEPLEFTMNHVIFSLQDGQNLVWAICAQPISEWEDDQDENTYLLTSRVLGMDDAYVYLLRWLDPLETVPAADFESYYTAETDGLEILDRFMADNVLSLPEDAADWRADYVESAMDPIAERLK